MRRRLAGATAIAALGAVGVLAATGTAGEDAAVQSGAADTDVERVAVERVPVGPRAAPRAAPQRRRDPQKLSYFEVPDPLLLPPRSEVAVELSRCPKGSEAVNGYFHPERPGTFLDRSRPVLSTARMWAIGAYNNTDVADQVTFGLVCLSDVK
jgi:hypothetical protein